MLFSPVFVASDPRPLFSAKPLRSRPLRVRSSLNPLECAVLDKHRVLPCFSRIRAHATPLECALPRVLIHKLFRMRSSEKSGGRGSKLLTRNRMNGPARQIARPVITTPHNVREVLSTQKILNHGCPLAFHQPRTMNQRPASTWLGSLVLQS